MIIGLYDIDMSKYIHVPLNLELAKLSSYYKSRGEIVSLSPLFSPQRYDTFFCRKDYYDGDFPSELFNNKNIIYGGRAFNMKKYFPLEEEIEKQKPDIYIYEKFRDKFCINKRKEKAFKTMLNADHFRLSLDGETIWNDFYKQINISSVSHTLFLHDYNLNSIKNSDIIIKEIMKKMSKNHKHLAVKFPIEVDNEKDLFKWISFSPSSSFFILQYNGIMEDEIFYELIEKTKGTSILEQFNYNITRNYEEEDFIKNKIQKVYKQIIFLRSKKRFVNLKYDKNFFTDKKWERIIELFQIYSALTHKVPDEIFDRVIRKNTMYQYASSLLEEETIKSTFTKKEVRDLFQLVREKNYECFKDFYECNSVIFKGGKFINE